MTKVPRAFSLFAKSGWGNFTEIKATLGLHIMSKSFRQRRSKMSLVKVALTGLCFLLLDAGSLGAADESLLVEVDGTASSCVVNFRGQVQTAGDAKKFPSAKFGYCNGSIQKNCSTSNQPFGPSSSAYEAVPRTCVGTFTSVEERQAASLVALEGRLNQQTSALQTDIRTLSNSIDSLNYRLKELEDRVKYLSEK